MFHSRVIALGAIVYSVSGCWMLGGSHEPATPSAAAEATCAPPGTEPAPAGPTGFDPLVVGDPQLDAMVGQVVYAGQTEWQGPRDFTVYMGDPLRVCGIVSGKADLITAAGQTVQATLGTLSRRPLGFALAQPGRADDLILALFVDGYRTATTIFQLQADAKFDLPDGGSLLGMRIFALAEHNKLASRLRDSLVDGDMVREDVLRNPDTKWAAIADDDRFVDWLVDGMADPAAKKKFERANQCIHALVDLEHLSQELRYLADDRREQAWKKGMEGVPPARVAAVERKALAGLDKDERELRARITRGVNVPQCEGMAGVLRH